MGIERIPFRMDVRLQGIEGGGGEQRRSTATQQARRGADVARLVRSVERELFALLGDLTDLEHVGGTRRALEEARRDDHEVTCGDSDEEGGGERS